MTNEWKKEQKILVAGAGRSGICSVRLLADRGYTPVLYDGNTALDPQELRTKTGCENLEIILGELTAEAAKDLQFCVVSPGIPLDKLFIRLLRQLKIPVISEIALAYHFSKGKVCAISGTNGKTTTTSLIGHIMAGVNPETFVVGNIGHPYTTEVLHTSPQSVTVAEISSFMLETLEDFDPQVTVLTNITPDHLDRHGSFETYIALKKKLCAFQHPDQFCVLNREEPLFEDIPEKTRAKIRYFSSQRCLKEGAFLREDQLILRENGEEFVLCRTGELAIVGRHNHENALAAALAARLLGAPVPKIREGLLSFTAVEHRMEYVCTQNGVAYYNDSKGTNPDSSIKAMQAMTGPTILLGGGYDKHSDYTDWVKTFEGKVKLLILMGATAADIAACVEKVCPVPMAFVASMEEAVALAKARAVSGDTVLLSPACASWGMYSCFEERGRHFKALVKGEL